MALSVAHKSGRLEADLLIALDQPVHLLQLDEDDQREGEEEDGGDEERVDEAAHVRVEEEVGGSVGEQIQEDHKWAVKEGKHLGSEEVQVDEGFQLEDDEEEDCLSLKD